MALILAAPATAQRQDVPTIDTEDATLGNAEVGRGGFRPILTLDVRNGDYARGAYDDDASDLSRVPIHISLAFAGVVARDAAGEGSLFVIGQATNGFHAPTPDERVRPRSWYESNSILALAWRPRDGVTTAVAYAIKTSPNGVSATTHEVSVAAHYARDDAIGWWKPRATVTARTKGDRGVFTTMGVAPSWEIAAGELSLPVAIGVGWGGFYARGSGDRSYGSAGAAFEMPVGDGLAVRAEVLALVRDGCLRRLDAPRGTTAAVVPLATIALVKRW